jgi:hypothetical protein
MRSINESPPPLPQLDMASTSKKLFQGKKINPKIEEKNNMALTQNSLEPIMPKEVEEISMNNVFYEMEGNNNINNTISSYPSKINELAIDEGLGPYKWLDDEIMKLRNMFENGMRSYVTLHENNEKGTNEYDYKNIRVEIMEKNKEMKSDMIWGESSNGESDEMYNCCSSMNSATDYDQLSDWDFCEEDKMNTCLWGTGIGEIMNGFY